MNQTIVDTYQYWLKKREVQAHVCWISKSSGRNRIKLTDMEDSHLLNVIKNVYASTIRAKDLPFIEEFQQYEEVEYKEWLRVLTIKYRFRKAEEEYRVESVIEENRDLLDYINSCKDINLDTIKF